MSIIISVVVLIIFFIIVTIAFDKWRIYVPDDYKIRISRDTMYGYNVYYIYNDYIMHKSKHGSLTADGPIKYEKKMFYYFDSEINITDMINSKGEKKEKQVLFYGTGLDSGSISIIGDGTYEIGTSSEELSKILQKATKKKEYMIEEKETIFKIPIYLVTVEE